MTTATITRRTVLGFGYTASCEQVWNKSQTQSSLQVCAVEKPDRTGTVRQLAEANLTDPALRSFASGGTCYNTAWFVKVDGKWRKIKRDQYQSPLDLLASSEDYRPWGQKYERYHCDKITVEVE
jgi:hypothetical protein